MYIYIYVYIPSRETHMKDGATWRHKLGQGLPNVFAWA